MKKILALAMTAGMLLCSMATTISAAPDKGSYGEVPLYKGGIIVDGQMDEAYSLGLKIDASHDYGEPWATDTTADIYMLHDAEYLYILYDVKSAYDIDPTNYNFDNANADDHWTGSGTELFIDWANDATLAKLGGWINGQFWGSTGTACAGQETKYVAEYKTTYDVAAKTYMLEWKLPMLEGAGIGSEVGFNAMITSNKDMFNGRQETICCTAPGLANNSADYLNITLTGVEVSLPEPIVEEPAAPQTFDMGVIAAVAAVVSAAGYAVSKKR